MASNFTVYDDRGDLFSERWWYAVADPGLKQQVPGGPNWLLAIIAVYLTFVLVLGPKLMKSRDAFKLEGAMKMYNVVNIICNAGVILLGIRFTSFGVKAFTCSDEGSEFDRYALFVSYLALKVRLRDTNKNVNQIILL